MVAPAQVESQPSVGWLRSAAQKIRGPEIATTAFLVLLFYSIGWDLIVQWWNNPDAGHGLLLVPVAIWLAIKKGPAPTGRGQPVWGAIGVGAAVFLRYVGSLAGELFTMRFALVAAVIGLVVVWRGLRQLKWWWLPFSLVILSIPLPALILNTVALPLQLIASKIGATMLHWRDVPFRINGNVITLPGTPRDPRPIHLFVEAACSGLRSLTALISIGLLIGGMWLRGSLSRIALIAITIPVAVLLNGFRIFLTGFLMFFVSREAGTGFMHLSEGWLIFTVALGIIAAIGSGIGALEKRWYRRGDLV